MKKKDEIIIEIQELYKVLNEIALPSLAIYNPSARKQRLIHLQLSKIIDPQKFTNNKDLYERYKNYTLLPAIISRLNSLSPIDFEKNIDMKIIREQIIRWFLLQVDEKNQIIIK